MNPRPARRVDGEEIVHVLESQRDVIAKRLVEKASGMPLAGTLSKACIGTVEFDHILRVRLDLRACPAEEQTHRKWVVHVAKALFWLAKTFGRAFAVRPAPIRAWPELTTALSAALSDSVGALLEQGEGHVVVSVWPEPEEARPARRDPTPWDRVAPILATVATGVGVYGFVTFVGGTIAWARVDAAGLPPAPTLGILPSQDLLVIGAETLVPTVVIAVLVVVILAVMYRGFHLALHRTAHRHWLAANERAFLAGETGLLVTTGMFLFMALALEFILFVVYRDLKPWQLGLAGVGVLPAAVIAALVGSLTRRFVYLGTTAFVLVGVFVGVLAYWRASNEERVRAAAVWREDRRAVYGIFVAEGSGRVYIAQFHKGTNLEETKKTSRLVGIEKSDVRDIAVADREPLMDSLDRAKGLADDLCVLHGQKACVIELPAAP
ncbi:hypothetical protein [Solirubrobacter ginsenosidimutans]|uniref:hypothetical protein n=1 Tax=Solirubrobacter ginsenosidimutans TaxID=490573 RepID=UPI0022CE23D3|nr:hypothetical protein [Solirubrobacter ginsenosidimutans]